MSKDKALIQYLRKDEELVYEGIGRFKRTGRKCGALVAVQNESGEVTMGWSKYACSREDKNFTKARAKEIALGRAERGRPYKIGELPYLVQENLESFCVRSQRYFGKTPSNLR